MKKPLFLDCESAGLRGQVFSAALMDSDGNVLFDGYFEHPALKTNQWLVDNVAPNLTGLKYKDDVAFKMAFGIAYNKYFDYAGGPVVAHMAAPVEANFFQELFEYGFIGEFSGPYPMLDTAPLLLAAGYDPTSEQNFAKEKGWIMSMNYKPHSALSDVALTQKVWETLTAHV